jgi:hypothetical protein
VHSPVGKSPQDYGVTLQPLPPGVREERHRLHRPDRVDHDALGVGSKKALYNYMHGIGLDADVRSWFDAKVPKTRVQRGRIARALNQQEAA